MENASKALIMAASILIGIIILSIAAYLFTSFGGTSKEIQEQIDSRVIEMFNSNFLKYQGSDKCTIHDIVNLTKFAQKENLAMDYDKNDSEKSFYINVFLNRDDLTKKEEKDWIDLLNNGSVVQYIDDDGRATADIQYYTCKEIEFEVDGEKSSRVTAIWFFKNN